RVIHFWKARRRRSSRDVVATHSQSLTVLIIEQFYGNAVRMIVFFVLGTSRSGGGVSRGGSGFGGGGGMKTCPRQML
ncbi:hypothetical protein FRX31_023712, partial [Thalictrum thalictroides]